MRIDSEHLYSISLTYLLCNFLKASTRSSHRAMASASFGGSDDGIDLGGDGTRSGVPSRSSCSPSVRSGAQRRKQPTPPRRRRGGCLITWSWAAFKGENWRLLLPLVGVFTQRAI